MQISHVLSTVSNHVSLDFITFFVVTMVTSLSESQEFEEVHVAQHVCAMGTPPGGHVKTYQDQFQ